MTRVRLGVKTGSDLRVCMRWIVYVFLSYSESTLRERVLGLVHRSSWRLPLEFCCNSFGMLLASSRSYCSIFTVGIENQVEVSHDCWLMRGRGIIFHSYMGGVYTVLCDLV